MQAIVFSVTTKDRAAAEKFLKEQIGSQPLQAPGFVAGYWLNIGGDQGTSIVVFESEDAATQAAQGEPPPPDTVTVESMDVAEVVAHA